MSKKLAIVTCALSLALTSCQGASLAPPGAVPQQASGAITSMARMAPPMPLLMPKSISPGLVEPAPMAATAILPANTMASAARRSPLESVQGPHWTQIPGSGALVAASPDGSLWLLSGVGSNKAIWHYQSGTWKNIPGAAAQIAVSSGGMLWAVSAGGGIYNWNGSKWTALGGAASAITIAMDGSVYVLSTGGSGDRAIWRYASGMWTQIPGAGVALAASFDSKSYVTPGGTVSAGGVYVLNSIGNIYYRNASGNYVPFQGLATVVTPTTVGGAYALGYPANYKSGTGLFYYNLNSPGWASESGAALSISAGAGKLYAISASGAIFASPIAVAPAARISIVSNINSVAVFSAAANGNVAPLAAIAGGNTQLSDPQALALDPAGNFYVANLTGGAAGNGSISVYAAGANGNAAPIANIAYGGGGTDYTGLRLPTGIAVDGAGNIYAANKGSTVYSITVYAPGSNGNVSPSATITGASTGLDYPTGITVDAGGKIYVTNYNNNSVTVYAPGANGNAVPTATIAGASTGLSGPWALALDATGNLYVANVGSGVTVYAPGANGNAAPTATINASSPDGVALDSVGNIYISNNFNSTITVYAPGANGNSNPTATIGGNLTGLSLPAGLAVQ